MLAPAPNAAMRSAGSSTARACQSARKASRPAARRIRLTSAATPAAASRALEGSPAPALVPATLATRDTATRSPCAWR
eukprot:359687-Chlamydomonas_euryale.AAC.9